MARKVLVTGANRGIGKAISDVLERRGCEVIRCARSPMGSMDDGWLGMDVTSEDSVLNAATLFSQHYGALDVLINNAGILIDRGCVLEDLDVSTLMTTIDTNVGGVMRVSDAFLPFLKKSEDARIINMSSRAGQLNQPMMLSPAYCISKTALNGLTTQQALAYAEHGVVVNCMSPGWVRTDMGGSDAHLSPEEGADTAVYLALEAGRDVSGAFWANREVIPW